MNCANPKCFGTPRSGAELCRHCETLRDAAFLILVCAAGALIIMAAARFS